MTFDEILKVDTTGNLLALYQEATKKREAGYCRPLEWEGTDFTPARGEIALKHLVSRNIPPDLADYRDFIMEKIRSAMPKCAHEGECRYNKPVPPPSTDPNVHSFSRGEQIVDGKIVSKPPFAGLLSMLADDPEPMPGIVANDETWTCRWPKDEADPVYVVLSAWEARRLASELEYKERLARGDISARYFKESIYVCGPGERVALLSADLTKENVTGFFRYKPVILTFNDPELERKLASVCVAVATVLPTEKLATISLRKALADISKRERPTEAQFDVMQLRWWPTHDEMRDRFKEVVSESSQGTKDMPAEVFDGWLGEVCRTRMSAFPIAYAWPALVTAASALMPRIVDDAINTNLWLVLVGEKGTGKTSAFDYTHRLLNLQTPPLLPLKAGSFEGMTKLIGNVNGEPRLFFPDEMSHLMKKASIENSSFTSGLDSLYNYSRQKLTITHGAQIDFDCRLSIAGGIVGKYFDELFGAASEDGFYDRFMFGQCPSGYYYQYRPFKGGPALQSPARFSDGEDSFSVDPERPVQVTVDDSVFAEADRWRLELKLNGRCVENALRVAAICAAFDGRSVLHAKDLGPALAFAKYQDEIRKILAPNPGKNAVAIVANKIRAYLKEHAPKGQWVNRRKMLHSIRVLQDYGPQVVEQAIRGLESAGEIEQATSGRQKVIRLNTDRF